MKNTILKFSAATLAMSVLTTAYAAADVNTIPATNPGFAVSITGLYLQPGASDMVYAVFTNPLPVPAPNWTQESVDPDYTAAFDLGLQYTLADGVDQLRLDWLHLSTNDTDSSNSGTNTSVAPPYFFGPDAQLLQNSAATGNAKFNVDDVNLAFGHLINLSNHLQIQPFMGINTAYLKQELTDTYTGNDATSNHYAYSVTTDTTSKFTGVGPRLGMDGTYFVTNQFSITAELAASLLVGSLNSTSNFNAYDANPSAGNDPAVNTSMADQTQTQVVPEIDSKLGVGYAIPFNSGSSLSLQAGYMFAAYINAINQVVPTSLVPGAFNNGTIAIETEGQEQSDLDLNGPYLSFTWTF